MALHYTIDLLRFRVWLLDTYSSQLLYKENSSFNTDILGEKYTKCVSAADNLDGTARRDRLAAEKGHRKENGRGDQKKGEK